MLILGSDPYSKAKLTRQKKWLRYATELRFAYHTAQHKKMATHSRDIQRANAEICKKGKMELNES